MKPWEPVKSWWGDEAHALPWEWSDRDRKVANTGFLGWPFYVRLANGQLVIVRPKRRAA